MLRNLVTTALPDWNKRVLTDSDFARFCEDEGLRVVEVDNLETDTGEPGLYIEHRGYPFIALDTALRGTRRSWVQWHEIGHYILHTPGTQFFFGCSSRIHNQANIVAACALMPRKLIRHSSAFSICEEFGYPTDLIELRFEIYRTRKF